MPGAERASYYQKVQVWPLSAQLNYEGWLRNFDDGNDRAIACRILDFLTYYPSGMVDKMLRHSVGQAGRLFQKHFPDWQHCDFLNRCYYSFIPGETRHPTDSGYIFTRKLRDILHVSENRIVAYDRISSLLETSLISLPIIFVDDFIGTGNQCIKAWSSNTDTSSGKTLEDLAQAGGHICVYATLLASQVGYNNISNQCPSLGLSVCHILGNEYNLFSPDCICWEGNTDLYRNGVEVILRKSSEVSVPDNDGRYPLDVRGFAKQGLAVAFEHGAPDAIPAFFYYCDHDWTPLIRKSYDR